MRLFRLLRRIPMWLRNSQVGSPSKPELKMLRLLQREATMPMPVPTELLASCCGAVPKLTASTLRQVYPSSSALDRALSDIPLYHDDYNYACRPSIEPEALGLELRRRELEGMCEFVDVFCAALGKDLITADDFQSR